MTVERTMSALKSDGERQGKCVCGAESGRMTCRTPRENVYPRISRSNLEPNMFRAPRIKTPTRGKIRRHFNLLHLFLILTGHKQALPHIIHGRLLHDPALRLLVLRLIPFYF